MNHISCFLIEIIKSEKLFKLLIKSKEKMNLLSMKILIN